MTQCKAMDQKRHLLHQTTTTMVRVLWLCLLGLGPATGFILRSKAERPSIPLSATKTIFAPPLLPIDGDTRQDDAPPLEVVYTTDTDTIEAWLQEHTSSSTTVLGFDTESIPRAPWLSYGRKPPNEKEGPATLQLSTLDSCLLVHLAHCRGQSFEKLHDILLNPSILKAGVGIDDDALEMYRSFYQFEVNSRLDLSCVLQGSSPQRRTGLRPLLAQTAGLDLPKSKKLSMSNWGAKKLTDAQLVYAAYDAWASTKIVDSLQLDLSQLNLQTQERPMAEINVRARKRKAAKTEWKGLKELEGEWTNEQRAEQDRLWQIMNDMRPDPPPMLNITMESVNE